jgi:putative solute:sodium symporter small subunit
MQAQGRLQADNPPDAAAPQAGGASTPAPVPVGAGAPTLQRHWRRTQQLTAALLLVWFTASFVGVFFAAELRQRFFGWPLGFWIASQGALLVFLAVVVVYAWAMARIDDDAGVAEEP